MYVDLSLKRCLSYIIFLFKKKIQIYFITKIEKNTFQVRYIIRKKYIYL